MTKAKGAKAIGPPLAAYVLASHGLTLLAPKVLRRRLARGKEDPERWREKLGEATLPRPKGRLVWLHAVGVGEVLALRSLISAMAAQAPDLSFLITSSARSSAQVIGANLPARTQHQYLPIDAPRYLKRFLDHWRPDLSIWAEQDIWPGAVAAAMLHGVPLALVNARITAQSHAKRRRFRGVFRNVLAGFSIVDAQDKATADRLVDLGAPVVRVSGSLKVAAPPLAVDQTELDRLRRLLAPRKIWLAASTHAGDEAEAVQAALALAKDSSWLLVLVPRDIGRAEGIAATLADKGLAFARRSKGEVPTIDHAVWLANSYGELGLWYRLADRALIGGGFDAIGGHNPWEAALLDTAILHGADVANFTDDYAALHRAKAAQVLARGELATALQDDARLAAMATAASSYVAASQSRLQPLAADLLALIEAGR